MQATFVWTWQDAALAIFLAVTLGLVLLALAILGIDWVWRKIKSVFKRRNPSD